MMLCIVKGCSKTINCIDRLYDHLRKHHQHISAYTCNYANCTRSYNVRASFFRHLKKHLSDEKDVQNIENLDTGNYKNDEYCRTESECNDLQPDSNVSVLDNESSEMTTINTNTELSIIDIQAVQNQMRNLSIGFNLKWLDVNVLPRKTVFEIQHDVQQKILKPFQEVVETMQIAGLLSVEGKKNI